MSYYNPAEDSLFLSKILKNNIKNKNIRCLDMGTGSGIQSRSLIEIGIQKENIMASDINPRALEQAGKLKINTITSNLFSNIQNKYDLIIFNPPYLPKSKFDNEPDITGGKYGGEVIIEFMKQLPSYLTKEGRALVIASSITPNNQWINLAENNRLIVTKIATKKIFFEELHVWEIKSSQ